MIAEVFKPTTKDTYASIFSALSEPVRIEIIEMISGTEELACTALEYTLPISKSTISYHIKVLYHAHLIEVRKSGRNYFYKLRRELFDKHLPGFLEQLQQGNRAGRRRARAITKAAAG